MSEGMRKFMTGLLLAGGATLGLLSLYGIYTDEFSGGMARLIYFAMNASASIVFFILARRMWRGEFEDEEVDAEASTC